MKNGIRNRAGLDDILGVSGRLGGSRPPGAGTDALGATRQRQTLEPPDTFPNIGTTRLQLASKRKGVPFAWRRDLQDAIGRRRSIRTAKPNGR